MLAQMFQVNVVSIFLHTATSNHKHLYFFANAASDDRSFWVSSDNQQKRQLSNAEFAESADETLVPGRFFCRSYTFDFPAQAKVYFCKVIEFCNVFSNVNSTHLCVFEE